MQIIQAAKAIIPQFHAFSDDEKRYHIGATWVSEDGLQDHHNLELRYTRNSESLALQGDPQPDGSWKYVEPNGSGMQRAVITYTQDFDGTLPVGAPWNPPGGAGHLNRVGHPATVSYTHLTLPTKS